MTEQPYDPFTDERSMTQDRVIDLLSLLAGADFRKPDPAAVTVWLLAARVGRWTTGAAFRAAAKHITHSTEFAKPAHITALIKLERPTVPDNRLALPAAPPASDEARAAARELFARHPEFKGTFAMPTETHVMGTVEAARKRADDQAAALAALDELISRGGAS